MKSEKTTVSPHQYSFPLYAIPNSVNNIYEKDKILYTENEHGETKILDNKNLPGTLGQRRLKINPDNLQHIPRVLLSMGQLVTSRYRRFIDKSGKLIFYKKSMTTKLITVKIDKVIPVEGSGLLLVNKKISFPIEIPAAIYRHEPYMRLLKVKHGYMFYGLSHEPMRDTWRKI